MTPFQSKHVQLKPLADGVAALVLDRQGSTVNFLDPDALRDLDHALDAAMQSTTTHLLIVRSGKVTNFCNGVPATTLATWTKEDYQSWARDGQKVCTKLVELPIPSVALIAGSCMDAGLELALACDYRVVVESRVSSFGFPSLDWGMIPCWGGTQRLPRVVGLENSLQMLVGGLRLTAEEAWRKGLADALVEGPDESPPSFLTNPVKRDWSAFARRTWRERSLESSRVGRWFLFRGAERIVRTRVPMDMPAPTEIIQALRLAFRHPDGQPGLDFEREALARLFDHPALHNLLRLLKQREKFRSTATDSQDVIHHVGIIGGGVLGMSLLMNAVSKGCEVVLRMPDESSLGAALAQIIRLLQTEVRRGSLTPDQYQKMLGAIRGTFTWNHFDKVQLVVDTTDDPGPEKQALYCDMEKHVSNRAILAVTPFAERVEALQPALRHKGRLVGLRIVEPWNKGSLTEIVVPAHVNPSVLNKTRDWVIDLGKSVLQVPDRAGGLVMRIWLPALNEAVILVREGVAIARIDHAMRRFGMHYGPLEWMDRLGLDAVATLTAGCASLFAGRFSFETGFALMTQNRWLGNRTGLGFYKHGSGKPKAHRNAAGLWRAQSQGEPAAAVPVLSDDDRDVWIQERLVTLTILEARHCLEEGFDIEPDDLDCAMCLTGWASHRGGPLRYARQIGEQELERRCLNLSRLYGIRYIYRPMRLTTPVVKVN